MLEGLARKKDRNIWRDASFSARAFCSYTASLAGSETILKAADEDPPEVPAKVGSLVLAVQGKGVLPEELAEPAHCLLQV